VHPNKFKTYDSFKYIDNQLLKWDGKLMIPLEDYPNISEKCSDFPDDHPLKIASAIDNNKAFLNFLSHYCQNFGELKDWQTK